MSISEVQIDSTHHNQGEGIKANYQEQVRNKNFKKNIFYGTTPYTSLMEIKNIYKPQNKIMFNKVNMVNRNLVVNRKINSEYLTVRIKKAVCSNMLQNAQPVGVELLKQRRQTQMTLLA
ncbi:hypothetical protein ABPG74_019123 [Tetrahymena malaccensis]